MTDTAPQPPFGTGVDLCKNWFQYCASSRSCERLATENARTKTFGRHEYPICEWAWFHYLPRACSGWDHDTLQLSKLPSEIFAEDGQFGKYMKRTSNERFIIVLETWRDVDRHCSSLDGNLQISWWSRNKEVSKLSRPPSLISINSLLAIKAESLVVKTRFGQTPEPARLGYFYMYHVAMRPLGSIIDLHTCIVQLSRKGSQIRSSSLQKKSTKLWR